MMKSMIHAVVASKPFGGTNSKLNATSKPCPENKRYE